LPQVTGQFPASGAGLRDHLSVVRPRAWPSARVIRRCGSSAKGIGDALIRKLGGLCHAGKVSTTRPCVRKVTAQAHAGAASCGGGMCCCAAMTTRTIV